MRPSISKPLPAAAGSSRRAKVELDACRRQATRWCMPNIGRWSRRPPARPPRVGHGEHQERAVDEEHEPAAGPQQARRLGDPARTDRPRSRRRTRRSRSRSSRRGEDVSALPWMSGNVEPELLLEPPRGGQLRREMSMPTGGASPSEPGRDVGGPAAELDRRETGHVDRQDMELDLPGHPKTPQVARPRPVAPARRRPIRRRVASQWARIPADVLGEVGGRSSGIGRREHVVDEEPHVFGAEHARDPQLISSKPSPCSSFSRSRKAAGSPTNGGRTAPDRRPSPAPRPSSTRGRPSTASPSGSRRGRDRRPAVVPQRLDLLCKQLRRSCIREPPVRVLRDNPQEVLLPVAADHDRRHGVRTGHADRAIERYQRPSKSTGGAWVQIAFVRRIASSSCSIRSRVEGKS